MVRARLTVPGGDLRVLARFERAIVEGAWVRWFRPSFLDSAEHSPRPSSRKSSRWPICRLVRPSPISSEAPTPAGSAGPARRACQSRPAAGPPPGSPREEAAANGRRRPRGRRRTDQGPDLLEHVPGRSGQDRIQQRLIVAERGEHQPRHSRQPHPDLPGTPTPRPHRAAGHPASPHRGAVPQSRPARPMRYPPRRSPGCRAQPPAGRAPLGGRSRDRPGRTRRSAFWPDRRTPCYPPGLTPDLRVDTQFAGHGTTARHRLPMATLRQASIPLSICGRRDRGPAR